jgi:hypothetical protein
MAQPAWCGRMAGRAPNERVRMPIPRVRLRRTAISQGYETRLACPCNVFAKVLGDTKMFAKVKAGANIKETALG